jgi:hypothetical protein
MDSMTAGGAYGFSAWNPSPQQIPETQVGVSGDIPGGALPSLPINWHNPLFWVVALFLVWSGYVYGAFDVGVKKIARTSFKVG